MLTLQSVALIGAAVLVPIGAILLGLALFRAGSPTDPSTTPCELVPHPIRQLVPADHRSTHAERQECRSRLGPSYDAHLVIVADILARRPGELSSVLMDSQDSPTDDLVTVSTYLTGPRIGLDRALRNGTAAGQRAIAACLTSGLHRFPAHRGACYGVARAVGVPVDVYQTGQTIVEPAFIQARTEPPCTSSTTSAVDTEIIFAFWSRTARLVGPFAANPHTVVFAAGAKFRVLGVQTCEQSDAPGVVFLSECPKFGGFAREWRITRLGLRTWWILAQFRQQMDIDPTEPVEAGLHTPSVLGFTPGFDQTGRPYQEDSSQAVQTVP